MNEPELRNMMYTALGSGHPFMIRYPRGHGEGLPWRGEKFETLPVTCVIGAIGQKVNVAGFEGVELNKKGIIAADETSYRTSMEGVFAVGDATNRGSVPARRSGALSEDLPLRPRRVS